MLYPTELRGQPMAGAKRVARNTSYRRSYAAILMQARETRGLPLCKQQNRTPFANPLDTNRVAERNKNILCGTTSDMR
jgi:hypothetical protein